MLGSDPEGLTLSPVLLPGLFRFAAIAVFWRNRAPRGAAPGPYSIGTRFASSFIAGFPADHLPRWNNS